jgi:hypothetical protein
LDAAELPVGVAHHADGGGERLQVGQPAVEPAPLVPGQALAACAALGRRPAAPIVRIKLARDANRVANEVERAPSHAAALLDDPRMAEPALAGMKARLLNALVAAGAVAIGWEG